MFYWEVVPLVEFNHCSTSKTSDNYQYQCLDNYHIRFQVDLALDRVEIIGWRLNDP